MNFTREPIIETVITPREGCKLVVRNSKGNGQEDYFVDAVEVVSFGHSFFFRSQERPKPFLVPVSDYEILELKETRMVLKNVSTDRSIKIGGGREAPPRPRESDDTLADSRPAPERTHDRPPMDRKRDKRRRGRRGRDRHEPHSQETRDPSQQEQWNEPSRDHQAPSEERIQPPESEMGGEAKAPSFISKLFPPPSTLIKESLSRYKPSEAPEADFTVEEKITFEEDLFEPPTPSKNESEEDDNEE